MLLKLYKYRLTINIIIVVSCVLVFMLTYLFEY